MIAARTDAITFTLQKLTMMDEVQRVSNRMTVSFLGGLATGVAIALRKGLPVAKTAISIGASCAMVGTACFGLERVSNVALQQVVLTNNNDKTRLYISHAIGGAAGGGMVGYLYQFRVIPGIMLFTPAMLAVAFGEIKFEQARQARLQQLLEEIQSEETQLEKIQQEQKS